MAELSSSSAGHEPDNQPEQSASKDLADGLDLVLRAAKKAVKNVEPARLEELGRRALKSLEQLDSAGIGRKAARALDVHKIEEIAQEAGKELLGVVERVAERVEAMVGVKRSATPEGGSDAQSSTQPEASATDNDAESHPRIRVN